MIIESSAIRMNSQRSFASARRTSASRFTTGKISAMHSGTFMKTTSSTAHKTVDKDPDERSGKQDLSNSKEDLFARFSQSRSVRATSLENNRSLRSIYRIRTQSIGYLLHQFFWGNKRAVTDPVSALLTDTSNRFQAYSVPFQTSYAYAESEQTDFATKGTVVTASGKEINFNLEVSMSRSFYEEASAAVDFSTLQLTDPLVINLDTDVATVSDQKFYFDLDADGHAEQISQLNAGSGFLALDKNGDGIINDGSELFGTASGNGFADLAQYDQDGNGWIDEADEIFDKLLIWQKDENGKDVLCGLGAAGVGAICLNGASTNFSLNSATDNKTNAVIRQTGMFLYENGTAGTVQQVDFAK